MALAARTRPDILLPLTDLTAGLSPSEGPSWIAGAQWYAAQNAGDSIACTFAAGTLVGMKHLSADFLLDGIESAVFMLYLCEGDEGPRFGMRFSLLNRCAARFRMPLEAINQNRWKYPREGAWLKPLAQFERVDLRRVDRMNLTLYRKGDQPARWCMTAFKASVREPARLAKPLLPCGPLLDELGQSTQRAWPSRTRTAAELTRRLRAQARHAAESSPPAAFGRWGGSNKRQFEASGFFRRHHDGRRWWLVDPDGRAFWSSGVDCVRPEITAFCEGIQDAVTPCTNTPHPDTINYLALNFARTFGDSWREKWATIALSTLRGMGFNTVGNWSEWRIARDIRFPYVRPLDCTFPNTPLMYRGFPDVFSPQFESDARAIARQLVETGDDPAMIGYFLMNEPQWGFSSEPPAAGMLYTCRSSATRLELARFLKHRYGDDESLARAWQMAVAFDDIEEGLWRVPLTTSARADLEQFSDQMVQRFFTTLADACRAVDPVHLNLGARYHTVPPAWAIEGMKCFDVFSMNCYRDRIPHDKLAAISQLLNMPTMIGEFHYGALDVGLPASGIMRVADQRARGKAFRLFVEDAAADPNCVGAHYFTLYDQSALGRYDGENYAIGFVDVCHRTYRPLADAARATHERLYAIAAGEAPCFDDAPEYLPPVF